jgi:hypothetical protein
MLSAPAPHETIPYAVVGIADEGRRLVARVKGYSLGISDSGH